jgi:transcriptional regulator with XRE-family HTH domain
MSTSPHLLESKGFRYSLRMPKRPIPPSLPPEPPKPKRRRRRRPDEIRAEGKRQSKTRMAKNVDPALGPRLRAWRFYRELEMRDVAQWLGMSQSNLTLIETGKGRPTSDTMAKLAKLYRCAVDDLHNRDPYDAESIISLYGKLSAEGQAQVLQFMQFLAGMGSHKG